MLQRESRMVVADNSGAREVLIMHIPGHSHQKTVHVGDIVTVVVKKAMPETAGKKNLISKAQKAKAVVVRTKHMIQRSNGVMVRFDDNACVIVDDRSHEPVATRVFGPVARELRDKGFLKIISLASEVV